MNRATGTLSLMVNGQPVTLPADPSRRLSEVLREGLGLRGTKVGCDAGDCGACTVLLDGEPMCACLTPLAQAAGHEVQTVEGLYMGALQQAFLRHGAAQCGICTPGMLMAATALLQQNAKPSGAEAEEALGGALCRCTGYAKIIDAVLDAAPGAAPPSPRAGHAVGTRIERLDGVPKVAGSEIYGADACPDNALLVRAIRAPSAPLRFTFGDIETWRTEQAGDVLVFTAADIPGANLFGAIPAFVDQPALAETRIRPRGEAVALVAGDPAVVEALDLETFPIAWQPDDPTAPVHDHRPDDCLITGLVRRGDAAAAIEAAAHAAEAQIETPYIEHAYIEPEAGIAWIEGDTLFIQACTQAPVMDRDDTARILGLDPEKLRIVPTAAGGGFGAKLDLSLQPLVGLVALKTGRAARMIFSRSESMVITTKRHPSRMSGRAGVDAAGRLTGLQFGGVFNTGAYASWGPTVAGRVPVHAYGPQYTPAYVAEARAIHSYEPISGAFRGFGVPQAAILQETQYDDLAEKAGIDRLTFRRLNALQDGQPTVCGQILHGVGISACLDALNDPWHDALARAQAHNAAPGHVRHGVGIASCWYGCGNTGLPNPSTIRVGITSEGQLCLHQGATDIGQRANTVITQICADALGLPIEQFHLVGPDTGLTPDCGKTSASRQTYVTGKAALLAGQALRARILGLGNVGQDAKVSLNKQWFTLTDGDGERQIDLSDLPSDANGYALVAEETYDPPTTGLDENGQGTPYAVYGFGAQIAEVAVDTALGTVKPLRITAAHDLGRVINPLLAEGQVEGGIAQGLGLALMEEFIPGRTKNLHDYLIPTTGDMPEIDTIFVEVPDPEGPLGVKGLGEHVLIPTAPAILNAIRHATGARIAKLPALPHRVLAAIREAQT